MGDIGDELGLEALAFHLFLHCAGQANGDVVQVLAQLAQVMGHVVGVDLMAQIARRDGLAALAQAAQVQGPTAQGQQHA